MGIMITAGYTGGKAFHGTSGIKETMSVATGRAFGSGVYRFFADDG